MRDPRDFGINGTWCVSARKRDAELISLSQRFVGKIDNEICRIGYEIFGPNNFAAHPSNCAMGLAALLEITLVIFFRAPKFGCGFDLRDNRPGKFRSFLGF